MKISRTINGQNVEIELTFAEMRNAHEIIQHNSDKADIQDLYYWLEPEDIIESYHITKEKLDAGLDEMANAMRKNIDKWGTAWDTARDLAFEDYLAKYAC